MAEKKKVANPFAGSKEKMQLRREKAIELYLLAARESKQKYDCLTDLSKAVAKNISISEKRAGISVKNCSNTTLLRNGRYKSLLLNYLAENPSKGLKNATTVRIKDSPLEQSKALLASLELSNLQNENRRLRQHVATLESSSVTKGLNPNSKIEKNSHQKDKSEWLKLESKFIDSCQVISALLTNFSDILFVDFETNRIIDKSKRRANNVIVGEDVASPYFEWLKKHASAFARER